jgi:hypothetical protein
MQGRWSVFNEAHPQTRRCSGKIRNSNFDFIHVTPLPIFAGFDRLHDRVLRRVKMFRGVLVFGRVAAAHVAAGQAHPQVHPGVSDPQAILAAAGTWLDIVNLLHVFASAHFFLPELARRGRMVGARWLSSICQGPDP